MTARTGLAARVIARPELVTLQFRGTPSDGRRDFLDALREVCDTPAEKGDKLREVCRKKELRSSFY